MIQHIKYPSIDHFRHVIRNIKASCKYFNHELPTVTFRGTVKVHGTNASVVMTDNNVIYPQSKERVISIEQDNAGFAFFTSVKQQAITDLFAKVKAHHHHEITDPITIYGEWCGGNIQKGVGITGLPKMFIIFGCRIGDAWVDSSYLQDNENNIFNIEQFPTYSVTVDFNNPEESIEEINSYTIAVENNCPVAKFFGVDGIGEGIVWKATTDIGSFIFKVKGEKHSATKVKVLTPVDTVKLANIKKFVEYAVTENRLNQAVEQVFTAQSRSPDIKNTSDFLRWVINDVIKEESDTIHDSNLDIKAVNNAVAAHAKRWWMDYLKSL